MIIQKRLVSGNLGILKFLFPEYELVKEIPKLPTRPAIFIGKDEDMDSFIELYDRRHISYILYTSKLSEINLDDKYTLLSIIYEKYNRNVPKYISNNLSEYNEQEFLTRAKIYWLTGKWLNRKESQEKTFLNFVDVLNKSSMEMYNTYFDVVKSIGSYTLESSLLTFLNRVKEENYIEVSPKYRFKIKEFSKKGTKHIIKGIENSLDYNIDNHELQLLNMIRCIMTTKM